MKLLKNITPAFGLLATLTLTSPVMALQELDSSWTFTANGQSALANNDGTFRIFNINAADNFGPAGPGSAPDFVSDGVVQVIGTGSIDGVPHYAYAEPFRITQSQTFTIPDITITPDPPLFPESIKITCGSDAVCATTISGLGNSLQLVVTATLGDGSEEDATSANAWTRYTTSNPAIATVDENGTVAAVAPGTAFITATNLGATAVGRVDVVGGAFTVEVRGNVEFAGAPAAGATVTVINTSLTTTVADDGTFVFPIVPTSPGAPVRVRAEHQPADEVLEGISEFGIAEPGMIADVGIIFVAPQGALTDNAGFELGNFTDYAASGNANVVNALDTVVAPEGAFMAQLSTDPVGTFGGLTLNGLIAPALESTLGFDFNFITDELDQGPGFNDMAVISITPEGGLATEVLRITRDDLLAELYPVVPGPAGFDGMTGFLRGAIDLSSFVAPGQAFSVSFTVLDIGGASCESVLLIDNLLFE